MPDHERQSTDSSSNYSKVTSSIKLAGFTKVTLIRTHRGNMCNASERFTESFSCRNFWVTASQSQRYSCYKI